MTVARAEGSPERLAGSALRRLHYRATRRHHHTTATSRTHAATPTTNGTKSVVMGAGSAGSEHSGTANTSTESAATALTSVTGTDDSTEAEPPSTAPPHYHRRRSSPPPSSPPSTPRARTAPPAAPPERFTFDVPPPPPPPSPPPDAPAEHETHFTFSPPAGPEVAELRRQLEGAEVFSRRRSSTHQHSVPPPAPRRQSQVHVTPNPLEAAGGGTSVAGRTTIVVQQPSLSLDYGGCCTLLLQDEPRRTPLNRLLDVTAHITTEELQDFDKRYGSPHHARSQSVKAARSRGSAAERQLLGLPQQRARVASMPNTGVEEEYYRLRHFSITGKGVVNRGDSLRSRRSRSNTSVASSASSTEAGTRASAPCSLASSRDSSAGLNAYRVLVLGAPGVGKSSLVGQFMTSEYLHAYDTSIDDESGERSVCVLLAGEESEITFLDSPSDHVVAECSAHGYCVVYSAADRSSFVEAERRLQALWAAGHTARRAVILVANKADLARCRLVTTDEGKALATSYECKFIETSVGINHNVDELLVGLLTQIRLKQQHAERVRKRSVSRKNRSRTRSPDRGERHEEPPPAAPCAAPSASSTPRKRTRLSASVKVRGLLTRVWARDSKSKSCENLHVL